MRVCKRRGANGTGLLVEAVVAVSVLACSVLAAPAEAQTLAPDVQKISDIYTSFDKATGRFSETGEGLCDKLFDLLLANCITIAKKNKLPISSGIGLAKFKGYLRAWIKNNVRTAYESRGEARVSLLFQNLRTYSAHATAEAAVAKWYKFKSPGAYLQTGLGGDAKTLSPDGAAEPKKPFRVGTQLKVRGQASQLKLIASQVTITKDVGSAGGGNGVLDAGEWVLLSLPVRGTGIPYFSASAWFRTSSSRAWVDSKREHLLTEMGAGAHRTAMTSVWVYLSTQCADRERIPLEIDIFDTHRAPAKPQKVKVQLKVTNVGAGALADVLVDTDKPGTSDGSGRMIISAQRSIEISSGFTLSAQRARQAKMMYGLPEADTRLFKAIRYRNVRMIPTGQGYAAGDDLDMQTLPARAFKAATDRLAQEKNWSNLKTEIWFATDTEVSFDSTEPSLKYCKVVAPAKVKKAKRKRRRRRRRRRNKKRVPVVEPSVAKLPVACIPRPAAVSRKRVTVQQIIDLAKQHVFLVARPAKVARIDGLRSSDGHELVFKEIKFRKKLQELLAPAIIAPPALKKPKPVKYVFRFYFPVPVDWVAPPPPPPPEPAPAPKPPPPPPPAPVVYTWHFDLGLNGQTTSVANQTELGIQWESSEAPVVPQLHLRGLYGNRWRGVFEVDFLPGTLEPLATSADYSEFSLQGGVAYAFIFKDNFIELEPRVLLGLQYLNLSGKFEPWATIEADGYSHVTPVWNMGVCFRIWPKSWIGLHADMSLQFILPWTESDMDLELMGPVRFKFGGGISFRFK